MTNNSTLNDDAPQWVKDLQSPILDGMYNTEPGLLFTIANILSVPDDGTILIRDTLVYRALEYAKIYNHRQLVCMTVKEIESLKYKVLIL